MARLTLPPRGTGLVIFESTASFLLVFVAILGNSLILVTLCRNAHLRNTTNIYMAALAVTDLLNSGIPGTLFTSSVISGRMVYGSFGCRLSGFLVHYLTYVSMATMTLTAVNRYYRVVKPQCYKRVFNLKRSFIILICLWLLVAVFVLYPFAFSLAQFSFNPDMSFCNYIFESQASETMFTILVVGIFVVFCLSLVSLSYYRVSRVIRQHQSRISLSLQGVTAREIKLTKVLFTLVLAFALCWLPTFGIIVIIRLVLGWAPHPLGVAIPFLLQTASVVNPFIYGAMSPMFRRGFRQLVQFKRRGEFSTYGPHPVTPKSTKTEVPVESCVQHLRPVIGPPERATEGPGQETISL